MSGQWIRSADRAFHGQGWPAQEGSGDAEATESPTAPMTPAPPFLQAVSRGSGHKLWQEGHLVCERCWPASLGLGSSKQLYEWTWQVALTPSASVSPL